MFFKQLLELLLVVWVFLSRVEETEEKKAFLWSWTESSQLIATDRVFHSQSEQPSSCNSQPTGNCLCSNIHPTGLKYSESYVTCTPLAPAPYPFVVWGACAALKMFVSNIFSLCDFSNWAFVNDHRVLNTQLQPSVWWPRTKITLVV